MSDEPLNADAVRQVHAALGSTAVTMVELIRLSGYEVEIRARPGKPHTCTVRGGRMIEVCTGYGESLVDAVVAATEQLPTEVVECVGRDLRVVR
jgi:hypothetical protein